MLKLIKKLWLKRQHRFGTYVSADLSVISKLELGAWVQSVGSMYTSAPVSVDKYHATISYSRKPFPDVVNHRFKIPITARVSGWKIFDNSEEAGYRCLVAVLDCPELVALNAEMAELYGATSEFPEYIPHVTISYTYPYNDVPTELPPFELVFDGIIIEPLDEDKDMT